MTIADTDAENLLHLSLIWRGCGDARKLEHAMARVERHRNLVESALFANHIQNSGSCGSVSIIRDQQRIRCPGIFAGGEYQFAPQMSVGAFRWLPVKPNYLLARRMLEASENACFGDSRIAFIL